MEQRKHKRVRKSVRMECSKRRSPHSVPTMTDNISKGGMRITEAATWEVGDTIIIHFRFGGKARARIVRVEDGPTHKRKVFGLRFLKIDGKTTKKIKKFVKKSRKREKSDAQTPAEPAAQA